MIIKKAINCYELIELGGLKILKSLFRYIYINFKIVFIVGITIGI